jgi:hypothetical protein
VLLRTNWLLSVILKSKKKQLWRMKGNERLYERFLIRHYFKMVEHWQTLPGYIQYAWVFPTYDCFAGTTLEFSVSYLYFWLFWRDNIRIFSVTSILMIVSGSTQKKVSCKSRYDCFRIVWQKNPVNQHISTCDSYLLLKKKLVKFAVFLSFFLVPTKQSHLDLC